MKAFRPEAIHRPYQTVTCRYNSFAKTSAHIQDHDGLRVLNHIEALTIQSFPFYYKLTPTAQREIETLIGNAVPPLLAFKLAQYVKGVLAIPHL
ncbi:DNA cytosine methyltransferase [Candidatus Nitrososphaera gargensis]|uniref:DNA cytosine methyltransferase n=1 Tax=Candidatus Nitrososphaera gargensis TaxID=497727 RepID=UPI0011E4EB27